MTRPPGYQDGPSQTVGGLEAFVLGEVLRVHLEPVLGRWAGQLDAGAVERIRWAAAGIVKAGRAWARGGPHARPASGTPAADVVEVVQRSRPELLSTAQTAGALNVTPDAVKKLAQRGVIGQKVGRDHVFTRVEVDAYLATHDVA